MSLLWEKSAVLALVLNNYVRNVRKLSLCGECVSSRKKNCQITMTADTVSTELGRLVSTTVLTVPRIFKKKNRQISVTAESVPMGTRASGFYRADRDMCQKLFSLFPEFGR